MTALAAPTEMMTSETVDAREPRAMSYTAGTMASNTSCLLSMKLSRGSIENADAISVNAP